MTRWAALIAALLATSPAGAQCLGFQCPPGVLGAGTSGGGAPLDGFTTPTIAYSFRKLKSAYAGDAMVLRRASDNAEATIGYLGGTSFTGVPWNEAAAASHCNATTCFLKTWFDQSGAARDCTNTTAANQMTLIFNCNGSLPCFRTTAGNHSCAAPSLTPSGIASLSAVGNRSAGTGLCPFIRQVATATNLIRGGGANVWQLVAGTSISPAATDNVWHAANGVIAGAASVFNIDGSETTGTLTGSVTAGTPGIAGAATTTCNIAEALIWDNYQLTTGERSVLRLNQKSFFGTP
jgi:hypothetical protein